LGSSWQAFLQSCRALKSKPGWQSVCADAEAVVGVDNSALRDFFEQRFVPYQVTNPDGSTQGLITGYYEPKLPGSRVRTSRFRYPLYAVPDDLLTIDLGSVSPAERFAFAWTTAGQTYRALLPARGY
jgi:membrane-bound lytic murein transglycosylase A